LDDRSDVQSTFLCVITAGSQELLRAGSPGRLPQGREKVNLMQRRHVRLRIVSGNNQTRRFGERDFEPFVIQALDDRNIPISSLAVSFNFGFRDGDRFVPASGARNLMTVTDSKGMASYYGLSTYFQPCTFYVKAQSYPWRGEMGNPTVHSHPPEFEFASIEFQSTLTSRL
jgi:hypothetical protein